MGDDQIIQKQQQQTACFGEPSRKNETEVRSSLQRMSSFKSDSSSSSLPAWLQQYKNENKGITYNDQVFVIILSQSYLDNIPIIFYHTLQIKINIKIIITGHVKPSRFRSVQMLQY